MNHRASFAYLVLASFLVACASDPEPPALERLIEAEWTLPAGQEAYLCAYRTVPEDLFVSEFAPVIPLGTHHTVLTIGDPSRPDGIEPCGAINNAPSMLFGSGVGTNPFAMPPGVGMRIPAGKQLTLNLHLFNASEQPLSGLSGTDVRPMAPEDVDIEAEAVLAGPIDLDIPPGASVSTGTCTVPDQVTIFGGGSHMHTLGTHMTVTARPGGKSAHVLVDRDYSFDEQVIEPIAPFTLDAGEAVEVACSYFNPTNETVHWGESTSDEMCFAGLFWYPARGAPFLCAN